MLRTAFNSRDLLLRGIEEGEDLRLELLLSSSSIM